MVPITRDYAVMQWQLGIVVYYNVPGLSEQMRPVDCSPYLYIDMAMFFVRDSSDEGAGNV
jgi:hypothetical protein